MKPIYLDHHATTPCAESVVAAMLPYFSERYGNPASRGHVYGMQAEAAVKIAREHIAQFLGASPKEIIFTSGATEANNLAILGVAKAYVDGEFLCSAIEHRAVLDPITSLDKSQFETALIPVNSKGMVDPAEVGSLIGSNTRLVSVMLANNELGVIQNIRKIADICHEKGVLLHVDAAQATAWQSCDVTTLGCDLMSVSAHKMYGPKGIGALYVRKGPPRVKIEPILYGGGHERGLRSGTLPTPLIVGFSAAAQFIEEHLNSGISKKITLLRNELWEGLSSIEGVTLNGGDQDRLPNNINCSFDGIDAESLILGIKEVSFSSGSACTSASLKPSHVLKAIGLSKVHIHGSVRFGLGYFTTAHQVQQTIALFQERIPVIRKDISAMRGSRSPVDVLHWKP